MSEENKKTNINIWRYLECIGFGCLCSLGIILAIFSLGHYFVLAFNLSFRAVEPLVTLATGVGGFFAGFISSAFYKQKGMLNGIVCGAVIYIIMLISNLSYGNSVTIIALFKFLLVTISSVLGGILAVNKKKKCKNILKY